MTKLRPAVTFADAITRVAGVLGFPEMARLVDRSDRAVRYWSEAESGSMCSLEQAKALDLAYAAAGGEGFPILESYALQVEVDLARRLGDVAELRAAIASVAVEGADAISTSIVIGPGSSPAEVYRAIAETEEACGASTRLIARLKSFLPGNGAGQADRG